MCALFGKAAAEKPREPFAFCFYDPVISTDRLVPGIDNVRFDVGISSKFLERCRSLLCQLIVKHSEASELLNRSPGPPKPADKKEFKDQLQDLFINALHHANAEKNPQLELLAHGAVFKYLTGELQAQYAAIVIQAREKVKLVGGPSHYQRPRTYQLQELLTNFQTNKRIILRRAGQELLGWIQEVRQDVVRKTRDSFFGSEASEPHAVFHTPLLFTEDGKDDYLYLEQYVMLGNFQRDPDRFELVEQEVRKFLEWADLHSEEAQHYQAQRQTFTQLQDHLEKLHRQNEEAGSRRGFFSLGGKSSTAPSPEILGEEIVSCENRLRVQTELFRPLEASYAARLDRLLAAPENASLLVDFLATEKQIAEKKKGPGDAAELASLQQKEEQQREALERLGEQFSQAGLVPYVLAAYEAAKFYQDFCPPINPQQLKVSLVEENERKKVAHLIREYRLTIASPETLELAARRVQEAGSREVRGTLLRFLRDFLRCQQDLRKFRVAQNLMDRIHLPTDPKQRELSEINHTLYRFLLTEEEKPVPEKVSSHVVLKADVRDSTNITAQLLARGLNPASYFSLNFFEPVRKLLAHYGATTVFLEGDAIILTILERAGDPAGANSVARVCCLAREMIEGVRAVNDRAVQQQLPLLELGVGICYQSSAPMYLMDGDRPIMISKAINESDRLSSCGKLARQVLGPQRRFFNVFLMQLLPEVDSAGASEEFLVRYNVHGIELSEPAFQKLCQELSLSEVKLQFPVLGDPEMVELYCGSLPLGAAGFRNLVIRRGRIPQLHPKDFRIVEYTSRYYYEVCTGKPLYDYVGRQLGWV